MKNVHRMAEICDLSLHYLLEFDFNAFTSINNDNYRMVETRNFPRAKDARFPQGHFVSKNRFAPKQRWPKWNSVNLMRLQLEVK